VPRDDARFVDALITPALVGAGYADLGDGVYKAGSREIEHFIYICRDPRIYYLLSGDIGIRNEYAEVFACDTIRTHGGEMFRLFKCGEPSTCTVRFRFEKLHNSGWPVHLSSVTGERLRSFVEDFVTSTGVWKIGLPFIAKGRSARQSQDNSGVSHSRIQAQRLRSNGPSSGTRTNVYGVPAQGRDAGEPAADVGARTLRTRDVASLDTFRNQISRVSLTVPKRAGVRCSSSSPG